jgi:hypothetical protein
VVGYVLQLDACYEVWLNWEKIAAPFQCVKMGIDKYGADAPIGRCFTLEILQAAPSFPAPLADPIFNPAKTSMNVFWRKKINQSPSPTPTSRTRPNHVYVRGVQSSSGSGLWGPGSGRSVQPCGCGAATKRRKLSRTATKRRKLSKTK